METNFLAEKSKNAIIKRQVLRMCIANGSYSIADFSRELNVSVPTVTKLLSELKEDGFVQDEGKIGTSGGRRPSIYGLNPNAGYFVGVDIGRHHFHIAVSDFKGKIIYAVEDIEFVLEATEKSFRDISKLIKDEVVKCGIPWIQVLAVGLSLAGRVNPEKGYSLSYFITDDIPLGDIFQRELNVPVSVENDSRAMAYGEYMTLGENSEKNMMLINLSWGLGMGMILGGELYYGQSGFSGEIGHFPFMDNGLICRCGKMGCLETGASGSALKRELMERIKAGEKSSLSKIYKEKGDISFDEILSAIEAEDVLAIDVVGQIGSTLGRSLAGIINIFNPGLVLIGGRLVAGKDYLLLPIRTAVNKYSLQRVSSDTTIRVSTLGRKAATIGNCLLARKKLLGI